AVRFATGAAGLPREPFGRAFPGRPAQRPLAPGRRPDRVRLVAKAEIEAALRRALAQIAPEHADTPILLERPKQADHGDFSSNVALQLAKSLKRKPRELAEAIAALATGEGFERPEIAGP